jgi:hypothetical protein
MVTVYHISIYSSSKGILDVLLHFVGPDKYLCHVKPRRVSQVLKWPKKSHLKKSLDSTRAVKGTVE